MFDSAGTIQFDTKLHWDWRRASDLNSCKDRVTDNSSPTSKGHTQPTYEMTPGFNLLQTFSSSLIDPVTLLSFDSISQDKKTSTIAARFW